MDSCEELGHDFEQAWTTRDGKEVWICRRDGCDEVVIVEWEED